MSTVVEVRTSWEERGGDVLHMRFLCEKMQTHGRFKVKNIQNENEQNLSSEHEHHEVENSDDLAHEGVQDGTVGRFKVKTVKVGEDENDNKVGMNSGIDESVQEVQQPQSSTAEIVESETKGRFKIKNVKTDEVSAENKPNILENNADNPEVKGRFKVKNVKPGEEGGVKEPPPNVEIIIIDGPERPRSKSSPHLNSSLPLTTQVHSSKDQLSTSISSHSLNTISNNSNNGSAKKGRFTVTTGGVNQVSANLMKVTTEVSHNPLSNGPVQFTSDIISSTQAGLSTSESKSVDEKVDVDSHTSVGIALEAKGNHVVSSAVKKPKSRFTVKTISLEDEREYSESNIQQSGGPLPPLPHPNPSPKTISQTLPVTSVYPRSKSAPDISFPESLATENVTQSFPSPTGSSVNRFQQLLETNFQVLMALQHEMKTHGLNIPDYSQQKVTNIYRGVHFDKSVNGSDDSNGESHVLPASNAKQVSSTPSTAPSSHVSEKDKDKSFGRMSHYVNELKKELDSAAKSRKEHALETQRLRERCIQLEEKLQSEKSKNSLLEEQLEKSLKKQRELQAQIDALLLSPSQAQQSSGLENTVPPPPHGTPTGTSTCKTMPPLISTCGPPPASVSSSSTPAILTSNILPPTKSNSTSNIPSLCASGSLNITSYHHDLSGNQTLNAMSTPVSAGNTPRISHGYLGSIPLHDNQLLSSSTIPVDTQLIPDNQSDEFENFIASRGAPIVEEWIARTHLTSPSL